MRSFALIVGLLAILLPFVAAWSKEDREIFRVRDELASVLGPDVTFYDFIGVQPRATLEEISRAYRKKTRTLHPDKVKQQLRAERTLNKGQKGKPDKKSAKKPGVHVAKAPSASELKQAIKKASDMQARLGIVANILRGPERDRYDHFLSHGFPVWKGTGYYYSRYRPGFGTVLFGLFLFVGGGAHYLALYMSWKRQREFADRYIRFARQSAWGESLGIAGVGVGNAGTVLPPIQTVADPEDDDAPQQAMAMNRKQRRMQERDAKREAAKEAAVAAGNSRRTAAGRRATAAAANRSGTATPTPAAAAPSAGPTGSKKRVVAQNGKILVVDSLGDVYLEQMDAEGNIVELLLDINEVPCPTFRDTAVYRLPAWAYSVTVNRVFGKNADGDEVEYDEVEEEFVEEDDDDSSPGRATPNTDEDFELVSKSTESLRSGNESSAPVKSSNQSKPKANKQKGKKR